MTDLLAYLTAALAWCDAHAALVGAIGTLVFYAAWNVSRRPPPKNRALWVLWWICEHLAVLPWDKFFGRWSPPFRVDPPIGPDDEAAITPRQPRGIASVRALLAVCLAVLASSPFACSWIKAREPVIIHVLDEARDACSAVLVVLPEAGPVCLAVDQADRLVHLLEDAASAGKPLTLDVGGKQVTVEPAYALAVKAQVVGAAASYRRAAPKGSAP